MVPLMHITASHTRNSQECIEILKHSNMLYRQMLEELGAVSNFPLNASLQHMDTSMRRLTTLQQEIETGDALLNSALSTLAEKTAAIEDLLAERKELLTRVHSRNIIVAKQAEAVKGLLRNEIEKIKNGHLALKSYRQPERTTNGVLKRAL